MTKNYAISDIHGCAATFIALLEQIRLSKKDKLFLLGDYINRGPRSKEVVEEIIRLQKIGYQVVALRGNHEQMLHDSLSMTDWAEGSPELLHSFGIPKLSHLPCHYLNWLAGLKPYHEEGGWIFVHAGLNFNVAFPFEDTQSLYWLTDWYASSNHTWLKGRKIVHGHVPRTRASITQNIQDLAHSQVLCIDNGVFLNEEGFGSLCCVELNSLECWFQENAE